MKYAIVLPDGAADEPLEQLDGQTPLEAARTPNLDWIGTNGRQGRVSTLPGPFRTDSDVSTMTLMGLEGPANAGIHTILTVDTLSWVTPTPVDAIKLQPNLPDNIEVQRNEIARSEG
jgi:hypothetical protein